MSKKKHPQSRLERIKLREAKEAKRIKDRASHVLKRKQIEELKLRETEDEVRRELGGFHG
jgi:hypothetical protein